MIKDGNSTGAPDFAPTVHAPEGSLPGDRWTGTTLGKYHIIRRLGRGGMGVVYEAKDAVLDRSVAIKVLRDGLASQPESVRRFLREARTAARLNHPHIVGVFEADLHDGMCYLVMELMEGGSAHDRIRKWGPFGWVEATQVTIDACRGLSAVHASGLIHRDIKPPNVMRSKDGAVKLTDFGLALTATSPGSPENSTPSGQVVGTPLYMSPEQCRAEKIDARSDVYSLGATYYALLTGRPPFEGSCAADIMFGHCSRVVPDARDFNQKIPSACAELIKRSMAKKPAERPDSAEALLVELETVMLLATSPELPVLDWAGPVEKTPISSTLVDALTPAPPRRRTRLWFVLLCLALMGIAYGAGRYFSQVTPVPAPLEQNLAAQQAQIAAKPGEPERTPIEFDAGGRVNSLAFDPRDNNSLGWGTRSGNMRVMDLLFSKELFGYYYKNGDMPLAIEQVAFSPAEGRYWVSLFNGRLDFREKSGNFPKALDEFRFDSVEKGSVLSFAFHPTQENIVALAFKDETKSPDKAGIIIRSLSGQFRDITRYTDGPESSRCMAFSADGSLLASARSNKLSTWKIPLDSVAAGGKELAVAGAGVIPVGQGVAQIVAITAIDNYRFAVAHGTNISIIDARRGEVEEVVHKDTQPISCLVASPRQADTSHSRWLAFAVGNSVMILDLESRQTPSKLHEHGAGISSLAFDFAGKSLASGDESGKVKVWPVK